MNGIPICVFYVYTENDDPASRYITARDVVLDVSSDSSYQLASRCLEECAISHEGCPISRPTTLPSRVLDCSNPRKPRLLVTDTMEDSYAALSYVWGEKQPNSTSTSNIDIYTTSGIDLNLIPRTIQDAIDSTRRFGLRYLWVDALCILQDSREDKDREIAQMRKIFHDAHVTLIAASSSRVSEGFLHDRTRPSTDTRLPFICPDGSIGNMVLSPVWQQYDETQEPVNSRAWCLEERLLSPRALIFAAHTLQYHCQTHTVNIGGSICPPRGGRRLPRLMFLPKPPQVLSTKEALEVKRAWYDIVEDYTSRDVTKPRDKLLALAGVVEKFHGVWNASYLAGLWQHNLVRDLLWTKDYAKYSPRPTKYRAPSWSWAAVDGRVVCDTFDSRLDPDRYDLKECELLQCEVSLANQTLPFGRVVGGIVRVRSPLRRVKWNPSASSPQIFEFGAQDGDELLPICDAYPDSLDEASQSTSEVWVLPILWNVEMMYAVGLIISDASEHTGSRCFRRVGYFSSLDNPKGITWLLQSPDERVELV